MTTPPSPSPPNGPVSSPSNGNGNGSAASRRLASPTQLRYLNSSILAARGLFGSAFGLPLDGLSFNGRRDLYQAFGFDRFITPQQYQSRYRRGGIAHRIVEAYPKATWSNGVDIIEDQDPKVLTDFESACVDLFERLIPTIIRADILANMCQYSVILIGAPGELDSPLPRLRSIDDVAYFNSYGQSRARITQINQNANDPLFGSPEYYTLTTGTSDYLSSVNSPLWSTGMTGQTEVKVHASRIIHVAEGCLEDSVYGQPRLEPVWNLLDSLDKIAHGGGEQAFRGSNPPTFINLDPQAPITADQESAMDSEIDDMIHGFQSYGRMIGANITVVPMRIPEIKDNADAIVRLISGTLAIPKRIFDGSEMGHLEGAENDEANFDDQKDIRNRMFSAPLIRSIVDRFVKCGALPRPKAESYEVVWPTTKELSEKERATVTQLIASANASQKNAEGKPVLTTDEMREKVWEMEPLEWEVELPPDPTDSLNPNSPDSPDNPDGNSGDNPADDDAEGEYGTPKSLSRRRLTSQPVNSSQQIVIIGGPRVGKSTLSKHFRDNGIPTYCGDPVSKVKDVESDVTYLPEGLSWSESSQYIADNWFTMAEGWCCEGIAMVRALRKWLGKIDYDPDAIARLRVIYLKTPVVEELATGQLAMIKGVETIWNEISSWFPQVEVVGDENEVRALSGSGNPKRAPASSPAIRVGSGARGAHKPLKPLRPLKQHGFTGQRVAIRSPR